MRVHVHADALPARPLRDPQLHGSHRHALPAPTEEQRRLRSALHVTQFHPLSEPGLQRRDRIAPHRDDALLGALPEHAHREVSEVHVAYIQAHELAQAQAR